MTQPTHRSQRTVIINRPTYVNPSGSRAYVIHNPRYADPPANQNARRQRHEATQRLWNHADRNGHAPRTHGNIPFAREYPSPTSPSPTTNLYARKLAQDLAHRQTTRSTLDTYYRQYYRTNRSTDHVRLRLRSDWNTCYYPRYLDRYGYMDTYSYPLRGCAPDSHDPTFGSRYGFHHHRFWKRSFPSAWCDDQASFYRPLTPNCVSSGITIWFNF